MTRSVYVTGTEPHAGKSIVVLGLMELLSARVERLGFFRPIIASDDAAADLQIALLRHRYQLPAAAEQMYGLSTAEAAELMAAGRSRQLAAAVLAAYKSLERDCDFVVCEGTDFDGAVPALDFDLNATIANELDAPVLVVVNGAVPEEVPAAVSVARQSLAERDCAIFGVFVGRVPATDLERVSRLVARDGEEPVYLLPEHPDLTHPTVADVAAALEARPVVEPRDFGQREVREVRVAAMSVEHFVATLSEGSLVIVPSDRADILLAGLASTLSPASPTIAGLVLTGGYPIDTAILELLQSAPFPVLEVSESTYDTAASVHAVQPRIRPDDERQIATALASFEAAADTVELARRLVLARPARVTPIMFEYELVERAKASRKNIVLPEGEDDRVLSAAEILLRRGVVDLTILGASTTIRARAGALGLDLAGATIIDPLLSPLRTEFVPRFVELRRHKGATKELAFDVLGAPAYFGAMMVEVGAADGMVSGAAHTTADTIRPAFELIRARDGVSVVSSVFFMCLSDRVLVYGDCAVNPKPTPSQLADIAISSTDTAATFGIEPRVAMLSYSTGLSGKGEDVDAVREATELVRTRRPDLKVEGPIQYDAAVDTGVARLKLPESDVAGRATVFVFPDLETGNVAYKAVQRTANAVAVGPVLQGLRKPVNDLSRGCTVTDIVNTVAITAIQAAELPSAAR